MFASLTATIMFFTKAPLPNDINGASKIKGLILEFADIIHYDVIKVGLESTSVYSFHPATFLAEDVDLKGLGIEVIVQNP